MGIRFVLAEIGVLFSRRQFQVVQLARSVMWHNARAMDLERRFQATGNDRFRERAQEHWDQAAIEADMAMRLGCGA